MMRNLASRATLAALLAGLGLVIAAGPALAATSPHWQVSYRSHAATAAPLQSVTAPSKADAWAVGVAGSGGSAAPEVLHWNGTAWSRQPMPAGFLPSIVQSSSPDNVWIFGSSGQEARVWNGSLWQATPVPDDFTPGVVLSASDVWGTAGSTCTGGNDATCTTTVWNWNGAAWSSSQVSGLFQDFAGAGSHAWLLMETQLRNFNSGDPTGLPVIYRGTGAVLQQVTAPDNRIWDLAQIAASPGGQLWMQASPSSDRNETLLFHWTGKAWTDARVPAQVGSEPFILQGPLTYDGGSGVWAGPYAHWTGTKWINAYQIGSMPNADVWALNAMAVIPGSASIWGAGWVGESPSNQTQDSLIAVYGGLP
jgi:hypothetical protein